MVRRMASLLCLRRGQPGADVRRELQRKLNNEKENEMEPQSIEAIRAAQTKVSNKIATEEDPLKLELLVRSLCLLANTLRDLAS